MGATFELIADSALQAEDPHDYPECHVCGTAGVPVYPCQGSLIGEGGPLDPSQDVYVACEACLKQGRVAHLGERRTDALIGRYAADPAAAKALLRRTPRIPFQMQGTDWPLCCGELAEFVGSPSSEEALIEAQAQGAFWNLGPASTDYDAREDGPPESLREVSLFRCRACETLFWVFQPS